MLKKTIPAFVEKTWNLLEGGEFAEVICWNEQGDAFRILNDHAFEHTVLPAYFKHSNLTSFQRQLNMYNFHKRKLENGQTEYHHRLFKKHQRELLLAIRRKPSEDEIEIGEELLRKLGLEHEETHQEPELKQKIEPQQPQPALQEKAFACTPRKTAETVEFTESVQRKEVQQVNYHMSYPFGYYCMANAFPSKVVGWCPEKRIKTYVLVQSPVKQSEGIC